MLGQTVEGLTCLAEAAQIIETTEERVNQAELHRVRGDLLNANRRSIRSRAELSSGPRRCGAAEREALVLGVMISHIADQRLSVTPTALGQVCEVNLLVRDTITTEQIVGRRPTRFSEGHDADLSE
jgi:hypothetical protein